MNGKRRAFDVWMNYATNESMNEFLNSIDKKKIQGFIIR